MTGRNLVAQNIDYSKPIRTVPVTAKGKCRDCKEDAHVKLNVKGNVGATVNGAVGGHCTGKKCKTKPIVNMTFKVKIN